MGYTKQVDQIINSMQMLAMASDRLFKKLAQLTPEEEDKYKTLLESKILFRIDEIKVSASKATKSTLAQMADVVESMDNNEKQIQVLDIDLRAIYNNEMQQAIASGITDRSEIGKYIAESIEGIDGDPKRPGIPDFISKRREKTILAQAQVKLRTKLNKLQAAVIITNGIYQKINKRTIDVQTSTPTVGGSRYIETLLKKFYKPIMNEFKNIITGLHAANVPDAEAGLDENGRQIMKAAPDAIEIAKVFGIETIGTQFLLRSDNMLQKQTAAISDANVEEIKLEDFKQSPVYAVKEEHMVKEILSKNPQMGSVDASGNKMLNQDGQDLLAEKMSKYDNDVQKVFKTLNEMPNTYQKFATIAKYLDPPSTAAFTNAQSIQRSLDRLNGPWLRINDMQKLKMSSEKLSNPDEIRRLIKDNLVEVSNERKVGAERLYVEAQDPRNHYVTLLAITQMAEESGYPRRTTGQAFLDSIPEGLRSDPIVMQEAKRLDSIESKNFHVLRDILIDEASNPQVPAWLLMRILDVFSVLGVAEGDTEKEKFRSINRAVVAVASKALEAKGWRVATDAAGAPLKSIERSKRSKDRSGEIGMLFEKIPTAATTSSRKSTRFAQTQGAGPMAQLQSQSDSLDKKIAEAQAQMAQLQTQKQQLANQIKGENERNAQIQKAQQAQQQAAPMAAPAPATAKYRVVYKNANKF